MDRRDFVKAVCAVAGSAALPVFAIVDPTLEKRYSKVINGGVFRMTGPLKGYRDTAFINCEFIWPRGYTGIHFENVDNIRLENCYLDLGQSDRHGKNTLRPDFGGTH